MKMSDSDIMPPMNSPPPSEISPSSLLDSCCQQAKEETLRLKDEIEVDPSSIESLVTILLGQQESLYRAWAELEAKLYPIFSSTPVVLQEKNSLEVRSVLGERLVNLHEGYKELISRIYSVKGALNL